MSYRDSSILSIVIPPDEDAGVYPVANQVVPVVVAGLNLLFLETRRSKDQRVLSNINDILAIRDQAKHPGFRFPGQYFRCDP